MEDKFNTKFSRSVRRYMKQNKIYSFSEMIGILKVSREYFYQMMRGAEFIGEKYGEALRILEENAVDK